MAERIELTDEETSQVVGGAFIYYTESDGNMACEVEGIGIYNCSSDAKRKISRFFLTNPGTDAQDGVDYALANGLFW